MATPTKKPAKAETPPAPSTAEALSTLVKDHTEEHFVYVRPTHTLISTGSLILDSLVRVRSGGVVRLSGKGAELGKSSEGFVLMANYLATMPKAKGIYFKAEARLTPEIRARSGLKWVDDPKEWIEGTVFVYPVNVFEVMAETLEQLLPQMHANGEHLCAMIDSIDGLMLRSDRLKPLWTDKSEHVKVAGVPKLTKELFRRLGLPIVHYDVLLLATCQYTAQIQLDQYAVKEHRQTQASGGNSIAHQADYVFEYQARLKGDLILEKPKEQPHWQTNKTLGLYATIDIKKSGTDVTGSRPRIPIRKGRIGSAIWVEREIIDMLMGYELVRRRKSKDGKGESTWLEIDEGVRAEVEAATKVKLPEAVNGQEAAYKILDDPAYAPAVPYLFNYLRKLIGADDASIG